MDLRGNITTFNGIRKSHYDLSVEPEGCRALFGNIVRSLSDYKHLLLQHFFIGIKLSDSGKVNYNSVDLATFKLLTKNNLSRILINNKKLTFTIFALINHAFGKNELLIFFIK